MMETKLFIEEVIQQSFRSYTVMAENNIASATAHVRLNQGESESLLIQHPMNPTSEARQAVNYYIYKL